MCYRSLLQLRVATHRVRVVSGVRFRRNRRQAVEPAMKVICKNERAFTVLHGSKFTGANRLVKVCPPNAGGLARLKDVVGKLVQGLAAMGGAFC